MSISAISRYAYPTRETVKPLAVGWIRTIHGWLKKLSGKTRASTGVSRMDCVAIMTVPRVLLQDMEQ